MAVAKHRVRPLDSCVEEEESVLKNWRTVAVKAAFLNKVEGDCINGSDCMADR